MTEPVTDTTPTPTDPFPESEKTLLGKWGKLRVANQARQMLNNQRTANNCNMQDEEYRKIGLARMRWRDEQMGVKSNGAAPKGDEDMEVRFDSPQTITNHYHAPPAKPGLGKLAKLGIGAALLGTGIGSGFAIPLVLDALKPEQTPAPVVQPADDTDSWYEFGLWPPGAPTK